MPKRLSQLKTGDQAQIIGFETDSDYASQLESLGLIPGTKLQVGRVAPFGDPIEIRIRGYALALRRQEAECLVLEVL
jgi:ferrous iron transport protein A